MPEALAHVYDSNIECRSSRGVTFGAAQLQVSEPIA